MTSILFRFSGLALAMAACGCTRGAPPPAAGAALQPMTFFAGRTHGEAKLDKLFRSSVKVVVDGVGQRRGDTLILDQTIREGSKAPRVRRWTMRAIAPNLYSGTLTDANGPVRVRTSGSHAFIRYTMKGGFEIDQQLALQSNGRTLLNRLNVRKFGVRVATLKETIQKLD